MIRGRVASRLGDREHAPQQARHDRNGDGEQDVDGDESHLGGGIGERRQGAELEPELHDDGFGIGRVMGLDLSRQQRQRRLGGAREVLSERDTTLELQPARSREGELDDGVGVVEIRERGTWPCRDAVEQPFDDLLLTRPSR